MKSKTCKDCKAVFEPVRVAQPRCIPCLVIKGRDYQAKIAKKEARDKLRRDREALKVRKEKIKTRAECMRELQVIFNKYIRLRDAREPCICCDAVGDYKWDAGHYLSRGSHPWLAVNEDNVHKQRARPCNSDKSGNQAEYRKRLILKIGLERVEALENCNSRDRLSFDEITNLKVKYRKKIKELESKF